MKKPGKDIEVTQMGRAASEYTASKVKNLANIKTASLNNTDPFLELLSDVKKILPATKNKWGVATRGKNNVNHDHQARSFLDQFKEMDIEDFRNNVLANEDYLAVMKSGLSPEDMAAHIKDDLNQNNATEPTYAVPNRSKNTVVENTYEEPVSTTQNYASLDNPQQYADISSEGVYDSPQDALLDNNNPSAQKTTQKRIDNAPEDKKLDKSVEQDNNNRPSPS